MPKPKQPRHGSMQFWPRKRSKRTAPRIRSAEGEGLLAFAGYKMGMTHVLATDTDKNSPSRNERVSIPTTVLECPPMYVYSVRGYTRGPYGLRLAKEAIVPIKDKHLPRKVASKPSSLDSFSGDFHTIHVVIATQPGKTGVGQKRPQLFEVPVGGKTAEEQLAAVKELTGKEIRMSDVLKEGDFVDVHAITKGKGFQGPVKRFGIGLKSHKSEKGRRRPGSLGGWSGQQHVMYRVAMAGQMGRQQRVQYNTRILKITDAPIEKKGGFVGYGTGRKGNDFVVLQGSVPGPSKRLITLTKALRLKRKRALPQIEEISLESNQGK